MRREGPAVRVSRDNLALESHGGVAERTNAAVLKTVGRREASRGFESLPLRFWTGIPLSKAVVSVFSPIVRFLRADREMFPSRANTCLMVSRSAWEHNASCARPLRDSLLLMPDVIIRPTRASDDARQECEDLARAMTDRGLEPAIESPSEKGGALGSVDLFVEVTARASEHALHELVSYLTRHGWKKVREAEKQSKQDAAGEKQPHQGARMFSKDSASRVVMIAVGDTRTVMERSER